MKIVKKESFLIHFLIEVTEDFQVTLEIIFFVVQFKDSFLDLVYTRMLSYLLRDTSSLPVWVLIAEVDDNIGKSLR